ncbi:hypothetical protein [Desulfopila aestuarii]|uniref:Uncharacterized protein n=1 Tax=Desulfopila aestuarii DSM 18488 TaxID=1121416 RepID=A0A1M7Y0U6_9BACT|nr:hypothetical protein [Desulfopila aestuarii]SHO45294.1 hypothetical protein SAMN02745220_01025 [Desulfopila aestuarii DSM 18488]
MFTIDMIFDQMFPMLSEISWDLGTVLTGMVFLWLIAEAATLLWEMIDGRLQGHVARRNADTYLSRAEEARRARDTNAAGSAAWMQQDMVYKRFLRKSADSSVKGWR